MQFVLTFNRFSILFNQCHLPLSNSIRIIHFAKLQVSSIYPTYRVGIKRDYQYQWSWLLSEAHFFLHIQRKLLCDKSTISQQCSRKQHILEGGTILCNWSNFRWRKLNQASISSNKPFKIWFFKKVFVHFCMCTVNASFFCDSIVIQVVLCVLITSIER